MWRGGAMRGVGSGHMTCGPMRGLEINYAGRGRSYIPADGHRDSMTESVQWADSVKIASQQWVYRAK